MKCAIPWLMSAALLAGAEPARMRADLWAAHREQAGGSLLPAPTEAAPDGGDLHVKMDQIASSLDLGETSMPFVFLKKGDKPADGWPLFINLHGGGGNPRASGPHAWPVNTREWQAQVFLFQKVYPITGLAFIPRMADDRDGRWYYGYVQEAVDRVIEDAILHHDVNPDRVYLTGISEGGYAAFRLASLMADRFAGSCAMAAAEPLDNAPPENLLHVAFRCAIGGNDRMFDRIGLARTYFQRLDELKRGDAAGFRFLFDVQNDRGHAIDYRQGPPWVAQHQRPAMPAKIHWTVIRQHDRSRQRLYWLALDGDPGELPMRLSAEVLPDNHINITAGRRHGDAWKPARNLDLRVYLPDPHLDTGKPVIVSVNGREHARHLFNPNPQTGRRSLKERGDPAAIYLDELTVRLRANDEAPENL